MYHQGFRYEGLQRELKVGSFRGTARLSTNFKAVGTNSVFYTISRVAVRASSILLLPIYTRVLSPTDYGLLALLEIATEVITIAFVAGTRSGMLRFYFASTDEGEKRRIVSTTFLTETKRAFAGAATLTLLAPLIWRYGLDTVGSPTIVRLAALRFALAIVADTPTSLMQAMGAARRSTQIGFLRLGMLICFNLLFLLVYNLGVLGMVLSGVIVNSVIAAVSFQWLKGQVGMHFDRDISKKLRKYGAPYQITMVGSFILTFGDRFILQKFRDTSSVGLYALAYQFGFLLLELGPGPFMRAWLPERFRMLRESDELNMRKTQIGFLLLNVVALTVATGIIVGSRPALRLLAAPAYQPAADIIPIIVTAYLFHIWNEVAKFGIDVAGRGIFYTYSSWSATAIVLVGYLILIPRYGGSGAAAATLLAFICRFALTHYWSQRFTPLHYGWQRILRMLALTSVVCLLGITIRPVELALQVAFATFLLAVQLFTIWRLVLSNEEREKVVEITSRRVSAFIGRPVRA
jgi:O-antigen/teichoic acid export membrane protein